MKSSSQLIVKRTIPAKPRPKPNANPQRRQRVAQQYLASEMRALGMVAQPRLRAQRRLDAPAPGSRKTTVAPVAIATGQGGSSPMIRASRDSSRIVHREFLANITGSTAFTVSQSIAVNPGLPTSFPWLSSQAQGWESYRFNKLRFCYYTRTGTNVPGSLLMIPDYDAADSAPASEQIASTYEDVSEDAPWKDIVCALRPSAMDSIGPKHFVRTGPLPANQDIKTFDVANLFVATVDGTAASWGKLWVEYDVEFFTPQLPSLGAITQSATLAAGGGTIAAATPFGAVPVSLSSGIQLSGNPASNVLTISGMQIGTEYSIAYGAVGTVITVCNLSTFTGMTLKSNVANSSDISAAQTSAGAHVTVTATAASGTVQVSLTATTITALSVVACAIPTSSF
jgi:hypothetical protein